MSLTFLNICGNVHALFFNADQKLHRLCVCAEQAGHHSTHQRPRQPASTGHSEDLPERERIRCVWEV